MSVPNTSWERNYEAFKLKRKDDVSILSVVPGTRHQSAKIIFDDNRTADFKYIWVKRKHLLIIFLLNMW